MSNDPIPVPVDNDPPKRPRLWVPVVLVALYWTFVGVTAFVEMPTFYRFLTRMGAVLLVALLFAVWWLFNRRVPGRHRLIAVFAAIGSLVLAQVLSDKTMGPFPIMYGLPVLLTAGAVALVLARNATDRGRRLRLVLAGTAVPAVLFPLLRAEGLDGEGAPDVKWRWSATAEDRYLARSAPASTTKASPESAKPLTLQPGDWPGFRGAQRDGVVRGVSIATDWEKSPPRKLWRRPIGPAWSSVAIVDGRLFTQEQRGEREAVVCLDAATGAEIWSHEEPGRFWDALSATGPRATPTFADGQIYAQGATGILVCLDAATGQKVWSRDVLADSGFKLPDWGVSSSPLVAEGLVVTYAGGPAGGKDESKHALRAYKAGTGDPAWSVHAGMYSYSSAQLATLAGREQVLFMSDAGLASVDPAAGTLLWEYPVPGQLARSCQPMPVGEDRLLVNLGMDAPTDLVDVSRSGGTFTASKRWNSRNLKPSFNDFVVQNGHIYGFDGTIFSCVELSTGNRKWKKGRYGTGQVVLLVDQALLLVISDTGEAVLVAAKPETFEELGRFQAISGKTWNHPVIVNGRLYVRNAEEIACYDLSGLPSSNSTNPAALSSR